MSMLKKKPTTTLVLALGILAVAFPLGIALYLAYRHGMEAESRLATTIVREILRRADAAGDEATLAHRRLQVHDDRDPCSDSMIALMRDIDMASSYLQVLGHVSNGRLMCSSLGSHGNGIPLGPVDYVSSNDASVRSSVDLGLAEGKRFLVMEKDHIGIAFDPSMPIDLAIDRPDVAFGLYGRSSGGRSSGRHLTRRGYFDPHWLDLALGESISSVDGDYLVTMQGSDAYDVVAYVAVPMAYLRSRVYDFARLLMPLGLVMGAIMGMGILKLSEQRTSLPAALRVALRRREFVLHYQPIVRLDSRRIVGVEALLRWHTSNGPGLGPDVFIPAAEACGLIEQFTQYVIDQVALDLPRLIALHPDCYVSINLASSDLHSSTIVGALRTLVQTRGILPANIVAEATEHSFLDAKLAKQTVSEIRELGIRVAIDDFGTGYSSLSHLTTLQTDYLKIDKVFVEAVGTDSATSDVALHIVRIAQTLRMKVIAEGVETEVQASFLREHGVELAQGLLFSDVVTIEQLLPLLTDASRAGGSAG